MWMVEKSQPEKALEFKKDLDIQEGKTCVFVTSDSILSSF